MSQTPLISVSDLSDDAVVVDVREDNEWHAGHAPNAIHVPMGSVPESLDALPDTDETIPVICRSGGRSDRVVQWLVQQGFDVVNVDGGMRAWAAAGKEMQSEDGSEPTVI
ncbi:rhodanese-like domain-containing protein [Ornithinimicrobium sp. F0845]|uniref:rhodanese-like domain-containing protein n=1 Tax=Ornithinimicrobium sp. F0845 TaxID=2926412 RepID=UPI001FF4D1D4|nr:rhodanese-like domain-containing protein [Ornithinimicrobium sp. F0845]MCK0112221.1 rhodanese-like domain-containing protein [Ornithinimicrobium sp. F0845]